MTDQTDPNDPVATKVRALLRELADVAPVGPPPGRDVALAGAGSAARPSRRSRTAWWAAAAAVVLVALVGGALVVRRGGPPPSPVAAGPSDVAIDTAALEGGLLAVVVDGDLYVADGATGSTRRLTRTDDDHGVAEVSVSPSGRWLAFTLAGEDGLWITDVDGAESHHLDDAGASATWSPAADEIAYATDDEVRVAQVDGASRAVEVGDPPTEAGTTVVWSPDGTAVAYLAVDGSVARARLSEEVPGVADGPRVALAEVQSWPAPNLVVGTDVDGHLAAADLATGQSVVLVPAEADEATTSTSGDRSWLVAGTGDGVYTCDLVRLTCAGLGLPRSDDARWLVPSAAPNGTLVAAVEQRPTGEQRLVVGDWDGHGSLDLGPLAGPSNDTPDATATTPALAWLDGTALLARTEGGAVVRVDVGSGERTTIVPGREGQGPSGALAYRAPTS